MDLQKKKIDKYRKIIAKSLKKNLKCNVLYADSLHKITALLLILIFLPFLAKSQTTEYNLPPKSFYRDATIAFDDCTRLRCKELTIKSDSASFFNINKRLTESVALANVDYMQVTEGNHVEKGIIYGALILGLTSVVVTMDINHPYNSQNAQPFRLTCTLTGAVVGGLIGLAVPKWKTYFLEN